MKKVVKKKEDNSFRKNLKGTLKKAFLFSLICAVMCSLGTFMFLKGLSAGFGEPIKLFEYVSELKMSLILFPVFYIAALATRLSEVGYNSDKY